jgi:hypothetical protein
MNGCCSLSADERGRIGERAMKKYCILPLFVCFVMVAIPGAVSAQNQHRSGFDPYVFITLSPDLSVSTQVVTEIHANVPFYIGIQLPPLLARNKDFSTDYTLDLTIFRPDGKVFLQKDNYYSSKEKVFEKSVFRFIKPMLMLSFDQDQTKGTYRIHVTLHDFITGTKTNSSCTIELM